jgi:hypothetical protein
MSMLISLILYTQKCVYFHKVYICKITILYTLHTDTHINIHHLKIFYYIFDFACINNIREFYCVYSVPWTCTPPPLYFHSLSSSSLFLQCLVVFIALSLYVCIQFCKSRREKCRIEATSQTTVLELEAAS